MPSADRRPWLTPWRRFLLRAEPLAAAALPAPESPTAWVEALASEGLLAAAAAHPARATFPPPLREALTARVAEQTAWRLLALSTLRRVLTALRSAGVQPLVLKGLPLAQQLFGDPHARDAGDLDLLVLPADLARSAAALEVLGFAPQQLKVPSSRFAQALGPGALTLRGPGGMDVDLHWSLGEVGLSIALDPGKVTSRARTISVEGLDVRVLADEDLLVYLSAHGGRHGWSRAGWVRDVATLLRVTPGLDGSVVLARAREAGLVRHLGVALALVCEEAGGPLPAWAHALASSRIVSCLRRKLACLAPRAQDRSVVAQLRWLSWQVRARERGSDRTRDLVLAVLDTLRWRGAQPVSLATALLRSPARLASLLTRRL